MVARRRSGERGVVAVIVAVALLALLMLGAAAVDIGKAVYVRSQLQMSVDAAMKAAAAASVSQPSGMTQAQIEAAAKATAKAYLKSNALPPSAGLVSYDLNNSADFSATYVATNQAAVGADEDYVTVTLNAKVPVSFFKLFIPQIPLSITGRVKRPRPAPVEMAMVIDNSSSMNDPFGTTTKLGALQQSATALVSTMMKGDYVRIGLVPFSWYIRIDPNGTYYNPATSKQEKYYDPTTLSSLVRWLTFGTQPVIYDCFAWQKSGCKTVDGTCYNDGVPYTCPVQQCDVLKCTDSRLRAVSWLGCLYIRPPPERTTISNPVSRPYYGIWSASGCFYAPMVTDLIVKGQTYTSGSNSYTAENWLNNKINALTVNSVSVTYIPQALVWAWNMLTTETTTTNGSVVDTDYPLNSGYTTDQVTTLGVRKVMVIITDGNNSGYAYTGTPNAFDGLGTIENKANTPANQALFRKQTRDDMVTLCSNIKTAGILIYVVAFAFKPQDYGYKVDLRDNCASGVNGNGYFFDVNDPAALKAAFNRIGASFSYNSLKQ